MNINKKQDGSILTVWLEGRLDTSTAPELEEEFKDSLEDITELHFDFFKLEYISSAGLRVLLMLQKIMNRQGTMDIKHVRNEIMEVFDITGFADILTII